MFPVVGPPWISLIEESLVLQRAGRTFLLRVVKSDMGDKYLDVVMKGNHLLLRLYKAMSH